MDLACWQEIQSTNRERAIKNLVHGQELATQLQILLKNPHGSHGCFPSVSADELVVKILRSLDETISVMTAASEHPGEICQNLANSPADSACYDDRRSEDSGESKKRAVTKDRRGCYKRKKISQSWTTVSHTTEDGQAWRKYGQKEILNATHPRSYFRCTRKYDQGCRATKQVQRMEENPDMFHTTYIGQHTCNREFLNPQIIPVSDHHHRQQQPPFVTAATVVKQEESKEMDETCSELTDNNGSASNLEFDSSDWKDFMSFEPKISMRSDYDCDMDFVVKSVDFTTGFDFEF